MSSAVDISLDVVVASDGTTLKLLTPAKRHEVVMIAI
jgi:hypothetical protein